MNGLEMMKCSAVQLASCRASWCSPVLADISIAYPNFDVCQPKEDGWAAWLRGDVEWIELIDRGGGVRAKFPNPLHFPFLIQGEWMFGTNWSFSHHSGAFVAFDMPFDDKNDLVERSYVHRMDHLSKFVSEYARMIKDIQIILVQTFSASRAMELWNEFVVKGDYEGLVFKDSSQTFNDMVIGRIKGTKSDKYVCMGMNEGGGRNQGKMGNVVGGMWQDGKLVAKLSVGGGFTDPMRVEFWEHKDEWVGRVFEAYGFQQFPSGSLRHPQWKCWRDDKKPEECVWPHK